MNFLHNASSILQAAGLVIAALFPIVNPIGSAAVFSGMVHHFERSLQRQLAQKIAVYSFFLLFISMLFGGKILSFFGVSLYAVQIGGGMVVAINSWFLLTEDEGEDPRSVPAPDTVLMRAFYPFTLPFTVGPGSISVAVALGAHLPTELKIGPTLWAPLILLSAALGCIVICLAVYFCYRWAEVAERWLGPTGTTVTIRLSSFISLCIGVQIVCSGIRSYVASFH